MSIFYLARTGNLLRPARREDQQAMTQFAEGEVLRARIDKPRNLKFHRKFFAMLQLVFENQERYTCVEDLLVEVKLYLGHYREHIRPNGEIVYVPKSISFAAMDEVEFAAFYRRAADYLCSAYFGLPDSEALRKEVEAFL
jgi:hypothetical protein